MKHKRLSKEQLDTLQKALSSVEVSQLQVLQSYINGLVRAGTRYSPPKGDKAT